MTPEEFDNQFDVLYNNITSNQAPGLNTYEKSVFLTKAQNEIVKNYFTANSKGNNIGQGFDDSAKRQADFSMLMKTQQSSGDADILGEDDKITYSYYTGPQDDQEYHEVKFSIAKIDPRSHVYAFPADVFIVINENIQNGNNIFQVVPLRYDEYLRLMSKPYKRPLKNQAWRLLNSGNVSDNNYIRCVEIITTPEYDSSNISYTVRYVRKPYPIIVGDLDGLSIEGETDSKECELDPILHEDILQRAVELAKVAWTATGQDNAQMVLQAGQRSE